MFVRMKTGARAGQIQEVEYATGRELVDLGRAEQVFYDDRAKVEVQAVAETVAPKHETKPSPAEPKKAKKKTAARVR